MLYRKLFVFVIAFLSLVFSQAGGVSIQEGRIVPKLLKYQGYLTDTLGIAIDDTLDMTFKVFDAVSSGNELWSETQTNVPIERGVFSVILGEIAPIPDSVFADFTSTWLELTLEGSQTLTPRTRITSVGYAYTSTYSDTAEYARVGVDNDWTLSSNILYPSGVYGLSMRSGNMLYGDSVHTHVNFGIDCTTGVSGSIYIGATVGGGGHNSASGSYTTVSGGYDNKADTSYTTISGGYGNTARWEYATVAGGNQNTAFDYASFVGGGENNTANVFCATVCGGADNLANGNYSMVGGGDHNNIDGNNGFIGGGRENTVDGDYSAVLGGYRNAISGTADYSYLFGIESVLNSDSTFMVDMPHIRFGDETNGYEFPTTDGSANQVMVTDGSGQLSWGASPPDNDWTLSIDILYPSGDYGLSMRSGNILYGDSAHTHVNFGVDCTTGVSGSIYIGATVGGGGHNLASGSYTTVGGGYNNKADTSYTTVGGGYGNTARWEYAAVAGGNQNTAFDYASFVGGGDNNTANVIYSAVCGGSDNLVDGNASFVGGGDHNSIDGENAFIGGGRENTVDGDYSAVLGGYRNAIGGTADYSYLFGIESVLNSDSTFMVDMPHIRFGDETNGYEFPTADGSNGQYIVTNGSGQLSWSSKAATAYTPTNSDDDSGDVGDIAWDDSYMYIKTSVGWKRAALSTW